MTRRITRAYVRVRLSSALMNKPVSRRAIMWSQTAMKHLLLLTDDRCSACVPDRCKHNGRCRGYVHDKCRLCMTISEWMNCSKITRVWSTATLSKSLYGEKKFGLHYIDSLQLLEQNIAEVKNKDITRSRTRAATEKKYKETKLVVSLATGLSHNYKLLIW